MEYTQQYRLLFKLDDISARRCKQFQYQDSSGSIVEAFVVYWDGQVYAYKNSCPHWEVELNWQQDDFLNFEQDQILCVAHGALFQITDGFCVHGPCFGQKLEALPVILDQGKVYLDELLL